jgi:hypothetical protein
MLARRFNRLLNGIAPHFRKKVRMKSLAQFSPFCAALLALCLLPPALADEPPGLTFSHLDWALSCDNTHTCRAAGYQSDEDADFPVSILLTRKAGPSEPVTGRLALGEYDGQPVLPEAFKLALRINGKPVGHVALSKKKRAAGGSDAGAGGGLAGGARPQQPHRTERWENRLALVRSGRCRRVAENG